MAISMVPSGRGKNYSGYKGNGEPDGEYWLSQFRKGVEFRKKAAFESEWETWRKYYRGEFGDGILPKNIFFKMVRSLVPRVYFRNPSISITPTMSGDLNYVFAQILERIDNKLIIKMRVKEALKMMVQNGFLYGTGIGKLGYGAQYTLVPDVLDTRSPTGKKRQHFSIEYDDRVQANMPWFMSQHTGSFVVPVGCNSIHSARWVASYYTRHIDDLKDDPRMRHVSGLEVSSEYKRQNEVTRMELRPREEGMIELVEFRDKKAGMAFIMAPFHSAKILYHDDDEMLDHNRLPYFPLIFNQDDLWFWGIPDAKILDPQQRELNETRTLMMKHRRLSIVKFITAMNGFSPDELQKLTSEEVGPVIQAQNEAAIASMKILDAANIPQGLVTMDALVEKDVQEILGLGSNQFGEYAPGSADRSATEASIVNQATQIRMDERRDAVADLLVGLFEQVHDVIFSRWDGEHVIDLVGPAGVPIWVRFKPDEMRSSGYNVNIDPDSTLPETKQVKEQKAMQVYAVLKQNPLIDPHKLTAYLLRAFHGAEMDDLMLTPEQAQQLAQQRQITQQALAIPGATPGNPMTSRQLAEKMPQLRAIQGGKA